MLNLKEYLEKYGVSHFPSKGGEVFYLANDTVGHLLNSTSSGYILNESGQVQEYNMDVINGVPYPKVDEEAEDAMDEIEREEAGYARVEAWQKLVSECYWFGETLDKYYPWPYFPGKRVVAVRLVKDMPTPRGVIKAGSIHSVKYSRKTYARIGDAEYPLKRMYEMPQYFQPLYEVPTGEQVS